MTPWPVGDADCCQTVVPVWCSEHSDSPQCPVCGYCDLCASSAVH